MDYRVLVLDLDGTTLNGEGRLEERDILAVKALQRAGVHVTIATGRLFTGTQWVAEAFGVKGSVAVMNGSELIDAVSGEVTHGRYVSPEHRRSARAVWSEAGLESAFLFGSRRIHIGRRDEHKLPYLETWTPNLTVHDDVYATDEWASSDDVVAVATMGDASRISAARDALHRELPDEIGSVTFQTHTGETFLKVRDTREDKGTALRRLAEAQGVTAAECVAVGDWLNDLPMLEVAGLSFAMGSSVHEVAEQADEVLSTERFGGGAVEEIAWRVWGVRA